MAPKNPLADLPEVFVTSTGLSRAVSGGIKTGELRQLGPRVYTKNLSAPPETIIARHLWPLISQLLPGALIADRTALELKPAPDGTVFVVSDRKRDIELPGLIIRPRKGPPPLAGSDLPFIGDLFRSSDARAYLDNMAPSRRRTDRVARTLSREEMEAHLEKTLRLNGGAAALNRTRDLARKIAPQLGREAEFTAFDRLLSSLLGTHDAPLTTASGRARQAGIPYDPDRLQLFERLHNELRATPPISRLVRDQSPEAHRIVAFFEAYFSNFIEGTKFKVDEARDIVFNNQIPTNRPADAHDIVGTWRIVSDPAEMSQLPHTPAALLELLKRRHRSVMGGRPETHPGTFKVLPNQAGGTVFVAPELVEGTLIRGHDLRRSLETPFARAVYSMFLVSEVHPFTDGNGRIARIMMNAELVAAGEQRIIIPTILRDNYIEVLRALSSPKSKDPRPLIRVLDYAQRWAAAVNWTGLTETRSELERSHAFLESGEAETQGVRLRIPDAMFGAISADH